MEGVRGRRLSRGILATFGRGKRRMNEYTVIEKHDGWAEVVLSRPARKNAIVPPMAIEVATAVNGLSTQQDVAAIVIRGSDGAFCSGVDLKVLQAKEGDADYLGEWDGEALREMHYALYRSAKPLIGVLERFAINAGAALVFACDLVVAGESSFLQIGEIQQGSDIPMNAGWLSVRSSEAVMARLALLGDRVPASELKELQLVTEVVPDSDALEAARRLAARLASFPEGASTVIKERLLSMRPPNPEAVFPQSGNNALLSAEQVRG